MVVKVEEKTDRLREYPSYLPRPHRNTLLPRQSNHNLMTLLKGFEYYMMTEQEVDVSRCRQRDTERSRCIYRVNDIETPKETFESVG
jgi:hypothetical protein